MLDLSTPSDVLLFLNNGPFASFEATPLSGGIGNYTFRLNLRVPFHGQKTAVLKHGKSYIPGMKEFAFDLNRQRFEVEAMRHARDLLPQDSLVSIPEIYSFDDTVNAIIMEDCADGTEETYTLTLKEYLLRTEGTCPSPPSQSTTHIIGSALGSFLSTLHNESTTRNDILDLFEQNAQARELSAWVTYGQLYTTPVGAEAKAVLSMTDPPFDISQAELGEVEQVAKEMRGVILQSRETLVHGDFWPGNVIVKFRRNSDGGEGDEVKRLYVIDWELAKPGSRGVEIGQFLGELHQAQTFCRTNAPCVEALRVSLLEEYKRSASAGMDGVASAAMIHIGAHLIVWTPRAWTWGEKEKIRETVAVGLKYLLNGHNREVLEISPAGPLLT